MRNRLATYYWISKKDGIRKSWFFPSRDAANKWKRARYYRFVDYPLLEDYLATKNVSRHKAETSTWNRHRDGFNDLIMKRGVILV